MTFILKLNIMWCSVYLGYNSVADGSSHVVKVDVDAFGAALSESSRDVFAAIVDGCSEAQVFH